MTLKNTDFGFSRTIYGQHNQALDAPVTRARVDRLWKDLISPGSREWATAYVALREAGRYDLGPVRGLFATLHYMTRQGMWSITAPNIIAKHLTADYPDAVRLHDINACFTPAGSSSHSTSEAAMIVWRIDFDRDLTEAFAAKAKPLETRATRAQRVLDFGTKPTI